MYTPIPIAVPAPKSVKSIVDKILLKEPSDKRESSGLVLVIFVNKLGYFEPKNEKTCCQLYDTWLDLFKIPHELTIIEQGYSYTTMQYLAIVSSYLHKQGCEYVTITFTL